MRQVLRGEWGTDLISSWNKHGWISLPLRVGAKLGKIIGAHSFEVVAADSTSVNLFKVVSAALQLRPDRTLIVSGAPPVTQGTVSPAFHWSIATALSKLQYSVLCPSC